MNPDDYAAAYLCGLCPPGPPAPFTAPADEAGLAALLDHQGAAHPDPPAAGPN